MTKGSDRLKAANESKRPTELNDDETKWFKNFRNQNSFLGYHLTKNEYKTAQFYIKGSARRMTVTVIAANGTEQKLYINNPEFARGVLTKVGATEIKQPREKRIHKNQIYSPYD